MKISSRAGWMKMRMSSLHPNSIGKFNDTNHIENFREEILEIYGIVPYEGEIGKGYGEEHTITMWADDKTLISYDGLPLDIIVHLKFDKENKPIAETFTWEPLVEYFCRKQLFKNKKEIANYSFGYIDGRQHHLDAKERNPERKSIGYTMWQEINRKPVEPLKQEIGVEEPGE